MKPVIHEVINEYTDDQNYTHIDVYHNPDPESEGKTVAIVCLDTKKVYYIEKIYRGYPEVVNSINEVLAAIDN